MRNDDTKDDDGRFLGQRRSGLYWLLLYTPHFIAAIGEIVVDAFFNTTFVLLTHVPVPRRMRRDAGSLPRCRAS